MQTIISPTDFSPFSINAVMYAADMAVAMNSKLIIFHAALLPAPVSEVPVPVYGIEQLEQEVNNGMEKLKKTILEKHSHELEVDHEFRIGNALEELMDYCAVIQPAAIVMGPETMRTGIERLLFGGKTTSALHRSQWPVIVVPPSASFKKAKRIALACDLENVTGSLHVDEIKQLLKNTTAELHVLHITVDKDFEREDYYLELNKTKRMLEEFKPIFHFHYDADVTKGILEFCERESIDTLIIVPKHHGLLERLFLKSNSKTIVLSVDIPVIAIAQ